MNSIVVYFSLDSGRVSEVREFSEEAVNRCAAIDGLDAGDQFSELAAWASTDNDVTSSSGRLCLQSTGRLK
jgi:hypothetical protein